MTRQAKKTPADLYRQDLAQIHVDGYGFHWEGAAPSVLDWFGEAGVPEGGLVVDLGCGGGQWLAHLNKQGYEAWGVDASEAMTRLAKKAAPKAKIVTGSFDEVELPECDAVTSLGEPLNYLNSGPKMRRTIKRVFKALKPGGLFVFDVRHPPDRELPSVDRVRSGEDWFCHSRAEETPSRLVRHITTFRRAGKERFRRDQETHRLKLFTRKEMANWLRETGFKGGTRRRYGDYKLGPRQSVFVCRKPKR
ncbi:dTDP-3-amino-3,4,6-trideoxy-alpha-D-glucopyranose [Pseudobythopirellula maris]|uniref:dTDP-3-amino-3,4, 6-trideoxy-alpha-D-glucopyranose n=1 Tax=Pseudobythopirellula maris TaxID=2527991 RepID=A0A5C5ZHL9_9BACT|nr:class I SAM-dependent methyltransferase [Pseudobythopirellula maris]TWT86844.1 dTDP-3-amino-3,4,6-trideoxy-alpha-D-glucopyranose [Pseudobythopirellula maris]